MSSFLFSTSATLALLSLLSFSTAFLVDLDGDKLRNGGEYYIVVRASDKGLTYTQINGCPLFITSENKGHSLGTPVTISTPLKKAFISIEDRVNLAFVTSESTPCDGSLVWKQTLMHPSSKTAYISTGGSISERAFKIVKRDRSLLPIFKLEYCGTSTDDEDCSYVGLFDHNGLLGIAQPTTISFKKAFSVLEMSTS